MGFRLLCSDKAVILYTISTLSIDFSAFILSEIPYIFSEWLCWVMLWMSSLSISYFQRRARREIKLDNDKLSISIIAVSSCRMVSHIDWAVVSYTFMLLNSVILTYIQPLMIPVIYLTFNASSATVLPVYSQESDTRYFPRRRIERIIILLAACISAVVLFPAPLRLPIVLSGIFSMLCQSATYIYLTGIQANGEGFAEILIDMQPLLTRNIIILTIMLVPSSTTISSMTSLMVMSMIKAVRWASIIDIVNVSVDYHTFQ